MPGGEFVPLGSWLPLPEARQAAQRLQAAGIPSHVRGEAAALVAADPARAVVCLEVAEEDLEHAQLILAAPPGPATGQPTPPREKAPAENPLDEPDLDSVATVEVFYDSLEAMHAAKLLRGRGIPCGLRGTTEGALPGLMPGIPNLRLEVRACDLEEAYQILGFTIDSDEGDEETAADAAAPRTDRIQQDEPFSSRKLKREPIRPPEAEDVATPGPTSLAPDRPVAHAEPSPIEAGAGGPDIGLILLLLLVAGLSVAAAIWVFR